MRCDFEVTGSDGKSRTVIEVKTVVDSDYDPATPPPRSTCVFFGPSSPYSRAAIFPWGKARQRGPSGEKVVSARAIKHLDQLAAIARGHRTLPDGTRLRAALVFIVVRPDALSFRPNTEACPSFAKHLQAAKAAGVRVLARRIGWSDCGSGEASVTSSSICVSSPTSLPVLALVQEHSHCNIHTSLVFESMYVSKCFFPHTFI